MSSEVLHHSENVSPNLDVLSLEGPLKTGLLRIQIVLTGDISTATWTVCTPTEKY